MWSFVVRGCFVLPMTMGIASQVLLRRRISVRCSDLLSATFGVLDNLWMSICTLEF